MFAHQVIEDLKDSLKEYTFPKNYADAIKVYGETIKNSHCFHLGNTDDALAAVSHKKGYKLFIDNSEYMNLPYDYCWFDAIKPNDNYYSKMGVLLFNHPTVDNVIGVSLYAFFKKYKNWTLLPMSYFFKVGKSFAMEELKFVSPNSSSMEFQSSDRELHNVCALILDENLPTENYKIINDACAHFLTVIENAILLLNCKNIITKNNYPDEKLNNARRRKGKQPLFSYKTLHLNVPSSNKKGKNISIVETNDHNRIHFCRGHFKSYTQDAPLFGKIVGLWWWQAHVRGQNKDGIVMKDYSITVNKEVVSQ
jgi:hypothetical protein